MKRRTGKNRRERLHRGAVDSLLALELENKRLYFALLQARHEIQELNGLLRSRSVQFHRVGPVQTAVTDLRLDSTRTVCHTAAPRPVTRECATGIGQDADFP